MVIKNFKTLLLSILCGLVFCTGHATDTKKEYHRPKTTQEPPCLTVWIHGTHTWNAKLFEAKWIRSIPGLHPASAYTEETNIFHVAHALHKADPDKFPLEKIFAFGWNGKLSLTEREKAAEELCSALCALIKNYEKKHGVKPKLRLITHSHGGNVSLLLTEAQEKLGLPLEIDELILLACPVQERTKHLIANKIFKNVWHFYSRSDLTQVIDPQIVQNGWHGKVFSRRRFDPQANLIQKRIKRTKHRTFMKEKFLKNLPALLENKICQHCWKRKNKKGKVLTSVLVFSSL